MHYSTGGINRCMNLGRQTTAGTSEASSRIGVLFFPGPTTRSARRFVCSDARRIQMKYGKIGLVERGGKPAPRPPPAPALEPPPDTIPPAVTLRQVASGNAGLGH